MFGPGGKIVPNTPKNAKPVDPNNPFTKDKKKPKGLSTLPPLSKGKPIVNTPTAPMSNLSTPGSKTSFLQTLADSVNNAKTTGQTSASDAKKAAIAKRIRGG